jgi:hypothetical protein
LSYLAEMDGWGNSGPVPHFLHRKRSRAAKNLPFDVIEFE